MTDKELFEYVALQSGDAYFPGKIAGDRDTLLDAYQEWLHGHAVVKGERGGQVRAYVGLIDNLEINAWAMRFEGRAIVGFNIGTILTLDSLFNRMMSSRQIMSNLGDIKIELRNPAPLLSANYLLELADPAQIRQTPRCQTRASYGIGLTKQALRFLLRHEMTHLCNGHCDYLNSFEGSMPFLELGWKGTGKVSDMDRQAMEVDADCCASSFWAGNAVAGWYQKTGIKEGSRLAEETITTQAIPYLGPYFFNWTFAVCSLFRLFGDSSFKGSDLTRAWYPPIRLRQAIACRTVHDHVKSRWDAGLAKHLLPIIVDAANCVKYAFETLTGQQPAITGLKEAFGNEGLKHIDVLIRHWNNGLRSRILPYALDGYLPSQN